MSSTSSSLSNLHRQHQQPAGYGIFVPPAETTVRGVGGGALPPRQRIVHVPRAVAAAAGGAAPWVRGPTPAQQQAELEGRRARAAASAGVARAAARDGFRNNFDRRGGPRGADPRGEIVVAGGAAGLRRPGEDDTAVPDSPLARAFFGPDNEDVLQDGLRAGVLDLCAQPKHVGPPFDIARQNESDLRSVMRGVFLERTADLVRDAADLPGQVAVLNAWVWREMVPTLYSAARMQYLHMTQFRQPVTVAALTRQADRTFHDDIDGRRRLQFGAAIGAASRDGGASAAAAGRSAFIESLRRDHTTGARGSERAAIDRLLALEYAAYHRAEEEQGR